MAACYCCYCAYIVVATTTTCVVDVVIKSPSIAFVCFAVATDAKTYQLPVMTMMTGHLVILSCNVARTQIGSQATHIL